MNPKQWIQLNGFTLFDVWNYEFWNVFTYIAEDDCVWAWGLWAQAIGDIERHDELWLYWVFDGEGGVTKSCRVHNTLIAKVQAISNPEKAQGSNQETFTYVSALCYIIWSVN